MNTLLDYAQAGFDGRQTDSPYWSSDCWLAEQTGIECRRVGLYPLEVKKSRGYSILINRDYLFKFDTKNLEFVSITRV